MESAVPRGWATKLIESAEETGRATGKIVCRERPGGLLRYHFYREAA